jgi:hypothetical protein
MRLVVMGNLNRRPSLREDAGRFAVPSFSLRENEPPSLASAWNARPERSEAAQRDAFGAARAQTRVRMRAGSFRHCTRGAA